jgi:hypothetical protein
LELDVDNIHAYQSHAVQTDSNTSNSKYTTTISVPLAETKSLTLIFDCIRQKGWCDSHALVLNSNQEASSHGSGSMVSNWMDPRVRVITRHTMTDRFKPWKCV